jgi:hypothetical protein
VKRWTICIIEDDVMVVVVGAVDAVLAGLTRRASADAVSAVAAAAVDGGVAAAR